jgi:hypothetical protein
MDLSVVYATTADYVLYTGADESSLPSNFDTMLKRASEKVTMATHRVYNPLVASYTQAAKYATCIQAQYWIENNGGSYIDDNSVQSYSLGTISVNNNPEQSQNNLCKQAIEYLISAGLLYKGVQQL